jgi:hypothetical protein
MPQCVNVRCAIHNRRARDHPRDFEPVRRGASRYARDKAHQYADIKRAVVAAADARRDRRRNDARRETGCVMCFAGCHRNSRRSASREEEGRLWSQIDAQKK